MTTDRQVGDMSEQELIKAIGDLINTREDKQPSLWFQAAVALLVPLALFTSTIGVKNMMSIDSMELKLEAAVKDRFTGKEANVIVDRVANVERHAEEDEVKFENIAAKLDGLILKDEMQRSNNWGRHALVHEAMELAHMQIKEAHIKIESKMSKYHNK